jgi:hypothetical protein
LNSVHNKFISKRNIKKKKWKLDSVSKIQSIIIIAKLRKIGLNVHECGRPQNVYKTELKIRVFSIISK